MDNLINLPDPASEEKQDAIVTALDAAPGSGGLATENKQDDAIDELQDIETDTEAVKTSVDAVKTSVDAVKTSVDAVTTKLGTLETDVEATNTKLGTIETDIEALLGTLSLIKQSTTGGTQKLTIPGDPFQVAGSSQACRSVLVVHSSDNAVYMNIGAAADVDDFPIPKNVVIPVPIDNCSDLNFFGTEADTIRLLWRD